MKRMFSRAIATAVILGAIAGCAGEQDTIIMAPVPTVISQFTPENQWSTSIDDGVEHYFSKLAPIYAYEKVFLASRDGVVKALDPETGEKLWDIDLEQKTSARLSGGIVAAYEQLFIGSENGEVIALSADTGELLWRAPTSGEVIAKPATEGNLVIAYTNRGILVGLDQKTGEQRWLISTEVPNLTFRGDSAPATAAGGVFWGTASGRLAAAIVDSGQLIWQQQIGVPKGSTEIGRLVDVDSSPIILGTTLYSVGINGQLIAIDLRSGSPIWKRNYSSALDMANDGNRLFIVTDKDHISAVDARSGTALWTNSRLENRLLTAPAIIDGYIVVGDSEGYLYWLDRDNGNFVAQQFVNNSGFAVSPIALPDGYLIVTRDGNVKKLKIN